MSREPGGKIAASRTLISSGGPWESLAGWSRAAVEATARRV